MEKEYIRALALAQSKLSLIDKLSNTIQEAKSKKMKDDIAYAIHHIIEGKHVDSDTYRMVAGYQIACSDIFREV